MTDWFSDDDTFDAVVDRITTAADRMLVAVLDGDEEASTASATIDPATAAFLGLDESEASKPRREGAIDRVASPAPPPTRVHRWRARRRAPRPPRRRDLA